MTIYEKWQNGKCTERTETPDPEPGGGYQAALDALQTIIDAPGMTNTQAVAAIKAEAQILKKLILFIKETR